MKIKSLIIPMMSPLLVTAANASLPDEINYSPYQTEYEQLVREVNTITANLERAKQALQYAYNQEASILNQISNLESENSQYRNQITNYKRERDDLELERDDLEQELNDLQRRVNRLERQRNQVERDIIREERRLAPIQDRVARIETNLSRQQVKLSSARKSYKDANRVSTNLRSQLEQLRKERKSIKKSLNNLKNQLANIDSQIQTEQTKLNSVTTKLPQAKQNLKAQKDKKAALAAEHAKLKAELQELMRSDRTNPRVKELRKKVANKAKEMKAHQTKVDQAKKQVQNLRTQKENLTKSVANLKAKKKNIPAKIKKTQASLKTKKELIATKKIEVSNAEEKTAQRRAEVDRLAVEENRIQQNLQRTRQELTRESAKHARLVAELGDLNTRVARVDRNLRSVSNSYDDTENRINNINNTIPRLERNIRTNIAELKRLDNELYDAKESIRTNTAKVNKLESEQSSSIAARDSKYQEYLDRYNYYGEKLAEAKSLGASQTDIALNIAQTDSNNYVDARSMELGTQMGENLANAQSNLWASVRAEISGYADGYEEGHASEVDEARGKAEGTKAGIRAAKDYANRILKPQFFNQYYAERIQSAQLKINEIEELTRKTFDTIEGQNINVSNLLSGVTPISSTELQESMNITTGLDQSIDTFKTNLTQVMKQKVSMGQAQTVYQSPSVIPYQTYDCSNVYKGVSVFKQACDKSYHNTFEDKYVQEYYASFAAQYNALYEDILEEKRSSIIEALYNSDMKEFYPVAKDSGIADGKAAIYKETYAQAKTNAYNTELPSARANADITAQEEVTNHINNNATLTLRGATITNSDLRGGSRAKVTVKVKNISPKSLTTPAKVIITHLENAKIATKRFYIKTANGNRTTDFTDINFQIDPDTRSNRTIVVEGKVILSGGKYNAERVETFRATATTAINPAVDSTYQYDSSPRVVTRFRRRTLIHNLDSSVSPKIETLRSGYTVKISAADGYERMIQFKNTSVTTPALRYGQGTMARFQYTLSRSAIGKEVKINLSYLYKGKLVKTDTIKLRPH